MAAVAELPAVRAALARVWSGDVQRVQLTSLPGGTQRRSWLVTFDDGRRGVLRMPVQGSSALLDVATEAEAMQAAARAGVAPSVLAVDAESGVLLTEYRPGARWTRAAARRPDNIARLAALLRALHGVATDVPVFAAEQIARRYLTALAVSPPDAPEPRRAEWAGELLELTRRYDGRYAPTAFCHNDLVAANVLDDGELALVDFEYAVRAEPLLDLANFAGMNGFGRAEQHVLLAAYGRAAPNAAQGDELASLVRMVRLMAWFWALLGAARATNPSPYARYLTELALDLQQE